MNLKYCKGIVTYRYYTGTEAMKFRYNINRHLHGPYDCDLEDFKKFFDQIKNGGEVSELYLNTEKGCYRWTPENGWRYIGQ